MVVAVYQVPMAEKQPFVIHDELGRVGEYPGIEGCGKVPFQMEIVVPFEKEQFNSPVSQGLKRIQRRFVMGERHGGVPEPKFEKISQDEEPVCFERKLPQEPEHQAVVFVSGIFKMGIGDEDCMHAANIVEKQRQVQFRKSAGAGVAGRIRTGTGALNGKVCGVLMGVAHEMEIVWDELVDAFLNTNPDIIYFLDRGTGEVFSVPDDYDDEAFWQEIEANEEQFLQIPGFDYDLDRLLLHEFIKDLPDIPLKSVLERTFAGRSSYGKMEDILSFYPDELETFNALKDEMLNTRIRSWLEEHDIYPPGERY